MAEFTLEQRKAIALAKARRKVSESNQTIEKPILEKAADTITPYWMKGMFPNVNANDKSEMFSSLPSSTGKLIKGTYDAVTHPVDTAKGLLNIGRGLVEKAIPGDYATDNTRMVDSIGKNIKDRYWGIENMKNTAKTDPAGMMLDLSVIPTVGAAGTAGVMKATSKVIPKSMPVNMMEKAINFRPTVNKVNPLNKRQITETIIKEGIDPTNTKGLDKAYSNINQLNNKVETMLDAAPKNDLVKKTDLLSGVEDVRKQFTGVAFKGKKNKQIIDKALKDFDDHLTAIKKTDKFTVQEVQTLKKELYKELEDAFKKSDFSGAETSLMQNVANKAKESIEKIAPNVKETNARLGKHYQMMEELPTIVNKMENYRGVGQDLANKTVAGGVLGTSLGAPFGYLPGAIGGAIGTVGGATTGVLAHPRVRASNALRLEKLRNSGNLTSELFRKQKIPLAAQGLLYAGQID